MTFHVHRAGVHCMVQGRHARMRGTPFGLINGATAVDAAVLDVPAGVALEGAVHILYINTGAIPPLLLLWEEES